MILLLTSCFPWIKGCEGSTFSAYPVATLAWLLLPEDIVFLVSKTSTDWVVDSPNLMILVIMTTYPAD